MMTYFKLASSPKNRVSRMVLIDAPGYPQRFPFFISVLRAPVLNRVSLNLVSSRARAKYILNHIFWNKAAVTEERIQRYAQFFDLPGSHDALIESARQIVPDDPTVLSGRIPDIGVPTMILWGKQDPLISLWQAERLHREIKGSRLEILNNCGHVPHEERPEDSAKLILDFLK